MNRALMALISVVLTGCTSYTPFGSYDYYGRHPEFPPRKPVRESYEYQIAIHRSWQDSVYVIAGKSFDEFYVGYSIADWRKDRIEPLKYKRLSRNEWENIQDAFERIGFFEWDVPCWEEAHRQGITLVHQEGECVEIVQTDGGGLSFLAVTPESIKAVDYPFSKEDEVSEFAAFLLSIAGIEAHRIPRWQH